MEFKKVCELNIRNTLDKCELVKILSCAGYTVNEEYIQVPYKQSENHYVVNVWTIDMSK